MVDDLWTRLRQENFPRILLLALAILAGGAILETAIEGGADGRIHGIGDALWYAVVTMTSTGYGDIIPASGAGRVVGVLLMFGGLTVLSVATATVASALVAQRIKEDRGLDTLKVKDHLLICGWNPYAENVLDTLFAAGMTREVVLVNELAEDQATTVIGRHPKRVRFVRGDASSEAVLERANVSEARAAIVVADASRPAAPPSDDRSILVTLALKSLRPDLRVTVEALDPQSDPHLRRAGADDIVIGGEFKAFLLSSAAVAPGISQVVRPLLTLSGSELRRVAVPEELVGRTYGEVARRFRDEDGFLAIAVVREEKGLTLDELLSDDTSLVDRFIKDQFSAAGREFLRFEAGGTRAVVNPDDDYVITDKDAIIGIPGRR